MGGLIQAFWRFSRLGRLPSIPAWRIGHCDSRELSGLYGQVWVSLTGVVGGFTDGASQEKFFPAGMVHCRELVCRHEKKNHPMITEPKLEDRSARPYMAVRAQATMQTLDSAIPRGIGEVGAWLGERGIAPSGPPFVRYLVIDMERVLELEIGFPVANALSGDERVRAGTLPAGRYASLIYTGIDNGIQGNYALLKWEEARGFTWDSWPTNKGDGWGARLESFLTNPDGPAGPAWRPPPLHVAPMLANGAGVVTGTVG